MGSGESQERREQFAVAVLRDQPCAFQKTWGVGTLRKRETDGQIL